MYTFKWYLDYTDFDFKFFERAHKELGPRMANLALFHVKIVKHEIV